MTDTTTSTERPAAARFASLLWELRGLIDQAQEATIEGRHRDARKALDTLREQAPVARQLSYEIETPALDLEAIMLRAVEDAIAARNRHTGIRYKVAVWRDINFSLPFGDARFRSRAAWDALDRLIKQGKVYRTDASWYGLGKNPKEAR